MASSSSSQDSDGQGDVWRTARSLYELSALDINGVLVSLDKYRDHVCLVVNVASNSDETDRNYTQLQHLLAVYAKRPHGLRILAFPCNQFEAQEPWPNSEIKRFVRENYPADHLDLFSKINVNGEDAHPLYKWLTQLPGPNGKSIEGNFIKFLLDKRGWPITRYQRATEAMHIEDDIIRHL